MGAIIPTICAEIVGSFAMEVSSKIDTLIQIDQALVTSLGFNLQLEKIY